MSKERSCGVVKHKNQQRPGRGKRKPPQSRDRKEFQRRGWAGRKGRVGFLGPEAEDDVATSQERLGQHHGGLAFTRKARSTVPRVTSEGRWEMMMVVVVVLMLLLLLMVLGAGDDNGEDGGAK